MEGSSVATDREHPGKDPASGRHHAPGRPARGRLRDPGERIGEVAGPEKLALILADQRSRWLAGSPVDTERYLELLPDLAGDPEARLALVAGELRAREEAGLGSTLAEYVRRFPDLSGPITAIFDTIAEHDEADGEPARG